MSYFDYFYNNNEHRDADVIHGSCMTMCPQDEIQLRTREKLVHVLEVVGNERNLVKCYSRSAADSNMAVPKLLRPYNVLVETVQYLLTDVTSRNNVPTPMMYDFVNDRLRAVRQDMTIQRLPQQQCAVLLEPMVRFYVFYGFKMFGMSPQHTDPVLNEKNLLECLKWFLNCCDYLDRNIDIKVNELSEKLSGLNIKGSAKTEYDRVAMESIYILCNINDVHPLYRYLSLSKDLKRDPTLKLSFKIALANQKGNFVQVGNLSEHLSPLLHCALCLQLPQLQRKSIQVLSHAYTSKTLTLPSSVLRRWLTLASDWETRAVCQHYGMVVDGAAVKFDKGAFKSDAAMHLPKIQLLRDQTLNLEFKHIYLQV